MVDTVTVQVNGEDRELFMSFGILNAIAGAIDNNVENVGLVAINPLLRQAVLEALLSPRNDKGKVVPETKFDPDADRVSIEDVNKVLEWAAESALDFFLSAMETQKKLLEKNADRAKKLNSTLSPAGSPS
jgi:hypothetical protein